MKTRFTPLQSVSLVFGFVLAAASLVIGASALHAQTPDASLQSGMSASALPPLVPDAALQQAVAATLPPAYVMWAPFVTLALMVLCRFAKAWLDGHGLGGCISGVLCGTNRPAKLPLILGGLCLLSLSSCSTATAILNSPFGRAVIASADQLAAQVVKTTERVGLEQIITQASAKVAALNAQGVNPDPVKETLRLSEIAGFTSVVDLAQDKYKALTGARFTLPKNPVAVLP